MMWLMDRRILYGLGAMLLYMLLTGEESFITPLDTWEVFLARLGIGGIIVGVVGFLVWRKE